MDCQEKTISLEIYFPSGYTAAMLRDEMITAEQAGKALGVSVVRVRVLIRGGRLPATKFGRAWMIRRSDLALVADRKPGRPGGKRGKRK